ncbi:hypothetical protein [Roseivirga pacifica]|uniref:hypothetical protein n=1 Tax=Roseivirga pacifica TaxID=1267423 RepID=UPI00209621CD|nr:hypothetical protein [Roseivirga pacifica]MCO6360812.1 hypothetical protein [Roseivirga pacifica]MCO6368701.1 hypothetical protein [Roseivirga pacifica]MCO6372844.1 hypothetical protein [Roseivirga pacifica]MCO6376903.1 hypothetical protein [Roseivirga pacifica]MCO6377819.1 hypothetical protein [Roseivirga pacifica]
MFDTQQLFDFRNKPLYQRLSEEYEIDIFLDFDGDTYAHFINNHLTIRIDQKEWNAHTLTHELLHAALRIEGFRFQSDLKVVLNEKNLSIENQDEYLEYISNWFDHRLMLPRYLKMGYNKKSFLRDSTLNKFALSDAFNLFLNQFLLNERYFKIIVAKYFSTISDPFRNRYVLQRFILNRRHPDLYTLLNQVDLCLTLLIKKGFETEEYDNCLQGTLKIFQWIKSNSIQ